MPDPTPKPTALRILLVEDEMVVRMTTGEMLADMGHAVAEAGDAAEALADLDGSTDLVITDLGLPGMDGLSLIAEIRRRRPGLPVIVASGRAAPEGLRDLTWLGKPYDEQTLRAAVAVATAARPD